MHPSKITTSRHKAKPMHIAVIGLGYVGAVLLAGLSALGHTVIGVGRDKKKLSYYGRGDSPFHEPGLNELLKKGVTEGRISVTDSHIEAIGKSDISFVCVATPSAKDGGLEMDVTMVAAEQIGQALRIKKGYHVVCFRSTLFAGSTEDTLIPILESVSGKQRFADFGVCYNPEFLREGNAVEDFYTPPFTVIGHQDARSAELIAQAYDYDGNTPQAIRAPIILATIKEAEALKYACNTYHALKVTFANEIASVYAKYNINPSRVMEIFCSDTKLNISPKYLRPGGPFGGSCLGKDLRVLLAQAKHVSVPTPLLNAIEESNSAYIASIASEILSLGYKKVGMLGLAFKEQTDDLRESPALMIAASLISNRQSFRIYDPWVGRLIDNGLAKKFISDHPKLVKAFVAAPKDLFTECDVIILTNSSYWPLIKKIPPNKALCLYDLTGSPHLLSEKQRHYIIYRSPVLPI